MLNLTNGIKKDRGFTIVELLVVIVVIGILAAITIVSYTGITTRANGSKAVANAQAIQSVAEAINADNGRYPGTIAEFGSMPSSARLPSGLTLGPLANVSAANGTTTFTYSYVGAVGSATGAKIQYWVYGTDTTTGAPSGVILLGATGTYTVAS